MPSFLHHRPSNGKLGVITIVALGILALFGLWIQVIEAAVLPSGYNVLHVEFAVTAAQMDKVIAAWLSMNVLHLEVYIDQLDVFMMPGWSILFFAVQVLALRALKFLDVGSMFRKVSWKLVAFPLIAGGVDCIENALIYHVLTNPLTYIRHLVPVLFVFVMVKWVTLFTGIVIGSIASAGALVVVMKRRMLAAPRIMAT
jgi:hypothetical protein